jgi:hypothetical protein
MQAGSRGGHPGRLGALLAAVEQQAGSKHTVLLAAAALLSRLTLYVQQSTRGQMQVVVLASADTPHPNR